MTYLLTPSRSLLLAALLLGSWATGFAQGGDPPETDDLSNYQSRIIQAREELDELTRIREKIQEAVSLGKFIQRLDNLEAIDFPVVLGDTISGVPIYIAFDDLRLYPEYGQLSVTVLMELPQREIEGSGSSTEYTTLLFGAPAVKFSRDGGIIGDAKIALLADFPIATKNPKKTAFVLKKNGREASAGGPGGQDAGTYVKIDCDGFVEMGIAAEIDFSTDWIVPINDKEEVVKGKRVNSYFSTVINDWNNMLFEVDLPNFALTKFPDATFNLRQAVFDFSDYRNSPNMRMPRGYAERYLPPGHKSLWRGIYIKELSVTLPKQFEDCTAGTDPPGGDGTGMLMLDQTGEYAFNHRGSPLNLSDRGPSAPAISSPLKLATPQLLPTITAPASAPKLPAAVAVVTDTMASSADDCRVKISATDLLIDFSVGVSGYFEAENVLNAGNMDSWPFTVEDLAVEIQASRLKAFGFGGKLQISLNKKGEAFDYKAFLNPPDKTYSFNVQTRRSYKFEVFKMAEVSIDSSSYVNIDVVEGKFKPSAVLTGYAAVMGKLGSKEDDSSVPADKQTFKAQRLEFNKLYVSTNPCRLIGLAEGGNLTFRGTPKLLGYPLPISDPSLVERQGGILLNVSVRLNLTAQNDNGFSAGTDVGIKGKPKMEKVNDQAGSPEFAKWTSDGLEVSDIFVKIKTPGLDVEGRAKVFEEDPIYGRGFQGSLSVRVGPDPQKPLVLVDLNAIFGEKDFKYWYVDGLVEVDKVGIPLIPGVLEANGFGGGAYYHMKMVGADLLNGSDGSTGTMSSGVKYEPDDEITLGLKASLAFRSPPPTETIDGVATLELAFSGMGLQDIMFYGRIEVVSPAGDSWMKKNGEGMAKQTERLSQDTKEAQANNDREIKNPKDAILGSVFLRMNFEYGFEFQGTFSAQISAAEGKIQGEGDIDILISEPQDRWHIYIGGYSDGSIKANTGTKIYPVTVRIRLGDGIEGAAGAYFLMGNDIPGPPPIDPEVAAWFGESTNQSGRSANLEAQAAQGAGFAFGAFIKAKLDVKLEEGSKRVERRNWLQGQLGAGFDISLLRYANQTRCSRDSRQSPHGHKGWRATGRLWAYADVHGRRRGKDFDLAMGIKATGDLPNPTYLSMRLKVGIRIVFKVTFNVKVEIGKECGRPVYATLDPALDNIHYATLLPLADPPTALDYQFAGGAGGR